MRIIQYALVAMASLAVTFLSAGSVSAQGNAALTGVVTSAEEGAMEGVLVSAKKAGSIMTITVVTDEQGRYRFPRERLESGPYALRIRAAGYELAGPAKAEVAAAGTATADLKLQKVADISTQLSNGEWLASMPGTTQQKNTLLGCVGCHTIERIVRSKHDADGFLDTFKRMGTYSNQSTIINPQRRLTGRDTDLVGEDRARVQRAQAEFLASVNLSKSATWEYPLKTFPRPKGQATRVIVTEYDLPRPTIQPHDVIIVQGMAWYSNFGEQTLGMLDPKTGKHTEFPVPEVKKGWPKGTLSIRDDREGNIWLGMMYQAAIGKFDTKTQKLQVWNAPPEWNRPNTQINMTSPMNMGIDGKIWAQNNGFAGVHRVDLKSGKWETWEPYKASPAGHNIYDVISDSQNNGWFTDIGREHVGRIDAKTGEIKLYETPTKSSGPRRGTMDAQDRIWFGQYRGNRIAMFDTKTEKFQEWAVPTAWSNPYDVAVDKNGEAWTGSMINDRVTRLDPKSGRFVEYLLPGQSVNIRRVFVDSTTTPVAFWVGSNHGASIYKLEPLE
jgi:virginiamycin B lyase